MPEEHQAKSHYWSGQHASVIKRHGARTADECAAFLYPYLDALHANFTFLDLGCGPGSITTDLARKYPTATFLGIDSGSVGIAAAQQFATERATPNASFRVADIMHLDDVLAWGTYDVVYCHQVLIHTHEPVEALRIMKRAAKPAGGIVAAREAFRGGLSYWPTDPLLTEWTEMMMDRIDGNAGDSSTGQKLIGLALKAGWPRDKITHTAGANSINLPYQRRAFAENTVGPLLDRDSETTKRLLASGAVDEPKIDALVAALRQWAQADDAWAGFLNGEVICRNDA